MEARVDRRVWALAIVITLAAEARGGEKQFGYVYEPGTLPPGKVELEQWITAREGKAGGHYSRLDLRTELEVGVIESLQTSLYLNLQAIRAQDARSGPRGSDLIEHDGKTSFSTFDFDSFSNEWIYKLADPVAEPVGIALYFEWGTDGKKLALEEKLIVASVWDGFTFAANYSVEQEWHSARDPDEDEPARELELTGSLGVAYHFDKTPFTIGVEFRNVLLLEGMTDMTHSVFQLGPTVHFATGRWWATLSVMPQIGSVTPTYHHWFDYDEYEVCEARLVLGVDL